MMRIICLIIMSMVVTSCSILSPVKNDPPSAYMINRVPGAVTQSSSPHGRTVLVLLPDVQPIYNTTKMAYTTKPFSVAYFSKNQWAETPQQMLLPLIVQTLTNTHHYKAVLTPPYGGRYDYVLNTQINQLQQNYTHQPAVLQFSLRAQIVNSTTNTVVATKQFIVYEPIGKGTPYNGVLAANKAVSVALSQLADFCQAIM